jgi:amino acid adenylation domain-containing protein/thioester reductase-like protein
LSNILLSPYHKVFYNEWQLDSLTSKYNIVFDQTISKKLNLDKLKNALSRVIADHLIFNSHVLEIDELLYWVSNNAIKELEIINGPYTDKQIFEYISQSFKLDSEPLYRFAVFIQPDGSYRLIFVVHNIILDDNSFSEFIQIVSDYYNDHNFQTNMSLKDQEQLIQFTSNQFYQKINSKEASYQSFWHNALEDLEVIDFKFMHSLKKTELCAKDQVKHKVLEFAKDSWLKLDKIQEHYEIDSFIYGSIIMGILLYRYTSQSRFGISYLIDMNESSDILLGAVANNNIYPCNFESEQNVIDLINQYKEFIAQVRDNGYRLYPINNIVEHSDISVPNIFFAKSNFSETAFSFNDAPVITVNHKIHVELLADLVFEQDVGAKDLSYVLKYNQSRIDPLILDQFINHYKKLYLDVLSDICSGEVKPISNYQLLSSDEYNKIVYFWNETGAFYPAEKTIHQLFEEQVLKTPDNIALVYEDIQLTYKELNSMSNQLAHYLRVTYKIQGDDLIALCLNRNENMLIAILGVLKSGGGYVPLDPGYPEDRISYILGDTKAKVLICNSSFNLTVGNGCTHILRIDSPEFRQILSKQRVSNPTLNISSHNLAYVIYTSGTTGKPKGVMIEHSSVINEIGFQINQITEVSRLLLSANYVFDASVEQIWLSLFTGSELHIVDENKILDVDFINNYVVSNEIECLNTTPTYVEMLDLKSLTSLKYIILGGEPLLRGLDTSAIVFNTYGPTEATIIATSFKLSGNNFRSNIIGRPIDNYTCYILDKNLLPLPVGGIGELYIGGSGLARGYLNLPELSQEKFISNPFQTEEESQQNINGRLYKTGDLVRYMSDGTIEYIGRNDFQVKIRGFRIELGEIESKILSYSGVKQAVVLAKEQTNTGKDESVNKYLIGYYVSDKKLDEDGLLEYLKQELPEYMVPSMLVYLDKLPLTIHGKLDKRLLPDPEFDLTVDYAAPVNWIEKQICDAYAEILHMDVNSIGINSDFFKIGGNSILVIRLVSRLQHKNNFKININEVFSLKTPKAIAAIIKDGDNNLNIQLERVKLVHKKLNSPKDEDLENAKLQRGVYLKAIKKIDFAQESLLFQCRPESMLQKRQFVFEELKPVVNVLLTGATGYFGCHVLFQLLMTTGYTVYVVVRAQSSEAAIERVQHKFKYYFNLDIKIFRERLIIIAADIDKMNLNLDLASYKNLIRTIDSIIHCAALVKHYGDYEGFYLANVLATINLLKLCQQTKLKDFHYISTVSVLTDGYIPGKSYFEFNEDTSADILKNRHNVYTRSKYQGEQEVVLSRKFGINGNIYRLGNMSMNSRTFKNQENIKDNAFVNIFKTMLMLGVMPQEYANVEISPVDCAAQSVVLLFDKVSLNNQTYHIFNPHTANLLELIALRPEIKLSRVTFNQFIQQIKACLEGGENVDQIELFMLHQGWLQEYDLEHLTMIHLLQDKTEYILAKLGFKWPEITTPMLSELID